ncbi:MAG: transglycosylase SLT domain-containing protein, partial [Gammaproteobacteria bacterium]
MKNNKNQHPISASQQNKLKRLFIFIAVFVSLFLSACVATNGNSKQDVGILDANQNKPDAVNSADISAPALLPLAEYTNRPHTTDYAPDTAMPWLSLAVEAEQPVINNDDEPNNHSDKKPIDPRSELFSTESFEESGTQNATEQIDSTTGNTTTSANESPDDIWQRIRDGFRLEGQDHRFVKPYIDWYAKHQAYLDRVVERARPYLYDIVEEIDARDMPMEIALLPVVESAFQPFAYSPGRAAGIWQFIPATGKMYGLKQNWWYDGRRDVPAATKAALKYLSRLHKRFDGDWLLALASYNSGEGRVARAIRKNKKKGRPTDFWSLDLPAETKGYVPKLLAISAIVARS